MNLEASTQSDGPVYIPGLEEEPAEQAPMYRLLHGGFRSGSAWDKFRRSTKFVNALIGGRGSSKSSHGCLKLYGLCCENPGLQFAAAGQTFAATQKSVEPLWFDVLAHFGAKYKWIKSERRCTLQNGASVQFFSGENWDKWPGVTLAGFLLDEAGLQAEEAYQQAVSFTRDNRALYRQILLTGTPEGFNWLYRLVGNVKDDDPRIDCTFVPTDESVKAGFVPQSFADELSIAWGPRLAEQYRTGRFVNARSGRVYHAADRMNPRLTIPVAYNPGRPLYAFFDFNNAPGVAVLAHRDGDTFQVFDEVWIETDSNTRKVCEAITEMCPNHTAEIVCYGDASGGQRTANSEQSNWTIVEEILSRHFRRFEIRKHEANPSHVDRANAVNRAFESDPPRVVVAERCAHLWQDLDEVSWVPGKNEIEKKKQGKAALLTHLSDALGYGIHYEMPVAAPSYSGMRALSYG